MQRTLPEYKDEDVLFKYYNASGTDHGLISVVALRGPVDDLPDRDSVGHADEWTLQGLVQCSPLWIGPGEGAGALGVAGEPVRLDGHVCWRSSGDFSVSVLATHAGLAQTASLVDEFWSTQ